MSICKSEMLLILGAGFSSATGLPLTKNLFSQIPLSPFDDSKIIFDRVKLAWERTGKGMYVEQWLREIYLLRDSFPEFTFGVKWEDVLDYILARLVFLPKGSNSHYYHGISTSIENKTHQVFWNKIRSNFIINTIITTNYDILIEQGLKSEYKKERTAPICYYGGYPYTQFIRKMTNVTTGAHIKLELGHEIELLKLHGSLNWVDEPHGYKIHDDVRAVFRKSRELGKPRIIPPLEEKEQPLWAFDIWERAKRALRERDTWFICGYSFPEYDFAINNMVFECGKNHKTLNLLIADPSAKEVMLRLEKLLPPSTKYTLLPGLPDLNDHLEIGYSF